MIDRFFTKTATLYRIAPAVAFPYDPVETLYSTFGCAMEALKQNEYVAGSGVHNNRQYRMYCPVTVVIQDTDKIVVDSIKYDVVERIPMDLRPGHHSEYILEAIA